jgi:uncharacterized membrane protein YidH (DUF202 family)
VTVPQTGPVPGHPDPDFLPDEDLERTDLAWVRSGLSLGVVGVVLLKRLVPLSGHNVAEGLIILGMGVAVVAIGLAFERHRRQLQAPSRSALGLVTVATAVIGLAALILSLVS